MPFDWVDYLTQSQKLAAETDEASLRSAISRAYYAAFNQARLLKIARGGSGTGGQDEGSHDHVWNYYRNHTVISYRRIAEAGLLLKGARVLADYRADALITQRTAQDNCQRAAGLILRLSNL